MSDISEVARSRIQVLEKYLPDRLLPDDWREPMKEILESGKDTHCYFLGLEMTKKIKTPAKYGYSLVEMAMCITPITTGQAIVFFQTIIAIDEYIESDLDASNKGSE